MAVLNFYYIFVEIFSRIRLFYFSHKNIPSLITIEALFLPHQNKCLLWIIWTKFIIIFIFPTSEVVTNHVAASTDFIYRCPPEHFKCLDLQSVSSYQTNGLKKFWLEFSSLFSSWISLSVLWKDGTSQLD